MRTAKNIRESLAHRKENGLFRTLSIADSTAIDFYSNDYLGLAANIELQNAFLDYIRQKDEINLFGSTGSRLVSGNHEIFEEAETFLAEFYKSESTLLFKSGYEANHSFFGYVPQKNDLVLYDSEIHASVKTSLRLCHAKILSFRHNDIDDLKRKITTCEGNIYVAVESMYSISGDIAPLKELAEICRNTECLLVVDEAHATGILGPEGKGLCAKEGIIDDVFARVFTFGKAMGCAGAVICSSKELKQFLINFAVPFIYSTAMPPVQVHSIMYNFCYLKKNPILKEQIFSNINYFKEKAEENNLHNYFRHFGHILLFELGDVNACKHIVNAMFKSKFLLKAMLPPSVPEGKSALRIIVHSFNIKDEIDIFFQELKKLF